MLSVPCPAHPWAAATAGALCATLHPPWFCHHNTRHLLRPPPHLTPSKYSFDRPGLTNKHPPGCTHLPVCTPPCGAPAPPRVPLLHSPSSCSPFLARSARPPFLSRVLAGPLRCWLLTGMPLSLVDQFYLSSPRAPLEQSSAPESCVLSSRHKATLFHPLSTPRFLSAQRCNSPLARRASTRVASTRRCGTESMVLGGRAADGGPGSRVARSAGRCTLLPPWGSPKGPIVSLGHLLCNGVAGAAVAGLDGRCFAAGDPATQHHSTTRRNQAPGVESHPDSA